MFGRYVESPGGISETNAHPVIGFVIPVIVFRLFDFYV
jgi:hypothetical protein